ncbi:MAG: TetR/AcrR family transcriptional regulator [Streptosporangiaceae bacterium]
MTEQHATGPQQTAPGKRAAQGRATRGQLIEVATSLFADHGYEGTSIEAVLAAAGVSRGALYHHFAGKEALFTAVLLAISDRVTAEVTDAIRDCTDPVDALHTGAMAWMDLAGDPVIQRVMLVDAPSVLGWEQWRAMDEGRTVAATRAMLQAVSDAGRLPPELVEPFSHMILAALDDAAMVVARAPDSRAAVAEGRRAVDELLNRLLRPLSKSSWTPSTAGWPGPAMTSSALGRSSGASASAPSCATRILDWVCHLSVADVMGAMAVGLLDAAQDRLLADVPGTRPGVPRRPGERCRAARAPARAAAQARSPAGGHGRRSPGRSAGKGESAVGTPTDPWRTDEDRDRRSAVHGVGDPACCGHRSGASPVRLDVTAVPACPGRRDPRG